MRDLNRKVWIPGCATVDRRLSDGAFGTLSRALGFIDGALAHADLGPDGLDAEDVSTLVSLGYLASIDGRLARGPLTVPGAAQEALVAEVAAQGHLRSGGRRRGGRRRDG